MPTLDLTEEERAEALQAIRAAIDAVERGAELPLCQAEGCPASTLARQPPSEGAALTSKPFLHDIRPMLQRMSVVEQKRPTAGGKSTPMLGCRWEGSTVRSRRSRRIKRLERRLAAAFSADCPGEYDPISKARFGAST